MDATDYRRGNALGLAHHKSGVWGAVLAFFCLGATAFGQVDDRDAFDRGEYVGSAAAADLRSQLAREPGNRDLRLQVLGYDAEQHHVPGAPARTKLVPEIEWLIADNPGSPILAYRKTQFFSTDFPSGDPSYARIVALWNSRIAQHPGDLSILRNALRSFLSFPISVSYAAQLRAADPYDTDAVTGMALALSQMIRTVQDAPRPVPGNEGLAKLTASTIAFFAQSHDAALIGTTGKMLVDAAAGDPQGASLPSGKQGKLFLERAQALDPGNDKWGKAAQSPVAGTIANTAYNHVITWLAEEDLWPGKAVPPFASRSRSIEVSWQDARLHQYWHVFGHDLPPLPPEKAPVHPSVLAGIQGVVKAAIEVDEKGNIRRFTPLSGVAQNIQAAREWASEWRFQPWLVNGSAVAFHTVVEIQCNVPVFVPKPVVQ